MSTQKNENTSKAQLLAEGAKSYLDAIMALKEYRREVQSMCREVFQERLTECGDALGVQFGETAIEELANPSEDKLDGLWAAVGVRNKSISPKPGNHLDVPWSVSLYLGWERTKPHQLWFGASVEVWWYSKNVANAIFNKLSKMPISPPYSLQVVDKGTYLSIEQRASDMEKLHDTLTMLLEKWIHTWRSYRDSLKTPSVPG